MWMDYCERLNFPAHLVEKILKGSLDLILSTTPSVKIQIMGRKVCVRCKGIACFQKFVDINQQCFALFSQVNFL